MNFKNLESLKINLLSDYGAYNYNVENLNRNLKTEYTVSTPVFSEFDDSNFDLTFLEIDTLISIDLDQSNKCPHLIMELVLEGTKVSKEKKYIFDYIFEMIENPKKERHVLKYEISDRATNIIVGGSEFLNPYLKPAFVENLYRSISLSEANVIKYQNNIVYEEKDLNGFYHAIIPSHFLKPEVDDYKL